LVVDKQKIQVDENYVKAVQHIISSYPEYCAFEDLPGFDVEENGLA